MTHTERSRDRKSCAIESADGTATSSTSRPARCAAALAARMLGVRGLVRAPIWLFRARLGFLVGSRLLMLEHVGRKSGARRYVVLEVVVHPSPSTYVVASGFGERAQWFRNIQVDPDVRIFVGGHEPMAARARILDPTESQAALNAYARAHPRSWRTLRPVFESTLGAPIGDDQPNLPLVRLETSAAGD